MPMNRLPFGDVVSAVREHTSLLLGTTIGFTDEDWAGPTKLSGWSRSHVAAHLAEGARAMVRVIGELQEGVQSEMYGSRGEDHQAIELGAISGGLALQIDLDTSASELQELLPELEGDQREIRLRDGHHIPARHVPLARLSEVVLHHLDLDAHFTPSVLAPDIALALLAFQVERIGHRDDYPPLRLVADEGYEGTVGRTVDPATFHGPAADLLAWLMRGVECSRIYREDETD
ncbi:maleylpyruvate isomerase family mycothiol-dependent enzyme [Tessaracoccus sp. MC1756]|uniref:maleylpyruvate isomerase family mycothiol-dependent enzyme n=1 Tax=Tessaracoccus sp. MC1756 TaxID=2760311 RepID=UPI001603F963|nr:maleylpyruvate isomerase family mycothiol-dependent enzyme [Tessaracoccus sp. MC1756]MBB1508931.1 maleylpyruvate isomerase family mycothiol-dependent enzyme [Tessaracoccus sp. MC1756]